MNFNWDSLERKMQFDAALEGFEDAIENYERAKHEWVYWANLAQWAEWFSERKN